ncbi:MAG: hypothetical protein ABEJ57_06295 [Halobacteriaceae archaeon]
MTTIVSGLVGGFVATVVMTLFMLTMGDDSPPPTALFWVRYVGDGDPDAAMAPGLVLHAIYGTVAGGVLAAAVPAIAVLSVTSVTDGLLWGLAYGVVLFVGAAVFWMNIVLDMDPEPGQVVGFLVFHLIYGVVVGAWLGAGLLA